MSGEARGWALGKGFVLRSCTMKQDTQGIAGVKGTAGRIDVRTLPKQLWVPNAGSH